MKENLKSLLLALLVVCSLIQSYFMIYRLPGSDPVVKTENDYIRTEDMGEELQVEGMLYPSQIALHLGDNRHTVFYPESTFYNLIYSRLKGRQFDGFQRYALENVDWKDIRSRIGVELDFGRGIPVALLQKVMQIASDPLFEGESISRLLIYNTENEDQVRVFFFSSQGDVVYEATKADLTIQDVRQQVDFGKDWIPYTLENGYYIPEKPIDMIETGMTIGLYTTEQMQRSLFFDASITRYIREKDGSEIYTDSKRSLQVKQDRNWINYTDPAAPATGENNPGRNALSAVDFVNQHGGWNGQYRLERTEGVDTERHTVVFKQYYGLGQYGAFPIIDLSTFHYGEITLEMRQGTITGYERSLIYPKGEAFKKKVVQLEGGDKLREQIAGLKQESRIVQLYPAYVPSLTKEGLLLKPMWVAELENGAARVLQ
ncbi:regulatory protein YycH of two-component signal transduction system YycFG [Fontibacillus solani]|uniref:Regulatory protein YycH of two-component signal transduction system YycFG n=1 Tax=Fontibacillus solani TaxID=1572857 RepID=A0A7W3STR7_9BACL|nr:two-component system activity regulator YycH [Fontibacillus solani]MBA9085959.1 regulatory protein YycH of two-component signal transduction system YycFG [Fontibacillus solani]